MEYVSALFKETSQASATFRQGVLDRWHQHTTAERSILLLTLVSTTIMGSVLLTPLFQRVPFASLTWSIPTVPEPGKTKSKQTVPPPFDLNPVRPEPKSFPRNSYWPKVRERDASGAIHQISFHPERDLVSVDDSRVWWESDNDDASGDTENDHLMHACMKEPFLRLVALVEKESSTTQKGVVLKVQDSFRAEGVHGIRSLHKQGRGLDLTTGQPDNLRTPGIPLSKLAKLCWAAGFDWVYYETRGGHHVHVSKRP